MKSNVKTVVIGAGNMGRHHARVYSEISFLKGIADLKEDVGMPLAKMYNTAYYSDYNEMLEREKPDAVSVVVPTKFHRAVVLDCLKRKIPTLVEKPIADSIADAKVMIEAAKKNNTLLMVGHIERFNPAIIKLKDLIKRRRFGKIINLVTMRVGINPPSILDSDVALDLAVHDIDIFNYLLNKYPTGKKIIKNKIFKTNIADSASILLEYDKVVGMIQTNWLTPVKMRKMYVTGTDGFAEIDLISQQIIVYHKHLKIKRDGDFFEFVSLYEFPKKEIYISKKEPLKEELSFFIKSAVSNKRIDNTFALNALRIILDE